MQGDKAYPLAGLVFPINALPAARLAPGGLAAVLGDAQAKVEAVRAYYQAVDADVLFSFSDIAVQAEAMGARVLFAPGQMPTVNAPAPVISLPRPQDVPRMAANAQVLAALAQEHPQRRRAALVYGPFTVAGQLAGEETLMRLLATGPAQVLPLLDQALEMARRYAQYQLEAGANLLWVSDPLAALVPPQDFERFAGQPLARLFETAGGLPTVLHVCGDTSRLTAGMVATGAMGISFDNCLDMLALEDQVPPGVCMIGNLDPVEVVELASPQEVNARTRDLVSIMAVRPNFAPCTGCAVPMAAPLDNVRAFLAASRQAWAQVHPQAELLQTLSQVVQDGDGETARDLAGQALARGLEPLAIIGSGLARAIRKGSAHYDLGQRHLPELLLMVDAFYQGLGRLEQDQPQAKAQAGPQIILGTVKGDIHEIGKNLVRIFLEAHGLTVLDLGVDVGPERFLEAQARHGCQLIGLSAFTSASRGQLKKVIQAFAQAGRGQVRFLVGGAALSPEVARQCGAHGFARDAVRAVEAAQRLLKSPPHAG